MRSFRKDNKGAIFAWIVAFSLILTYSVIWFTAGWATIEFMTTAQEQITFNDQAQNTLDILDVVVAFHPVIVIGGFLLYAFVSSQRRDVRFDY